MGSSRPGEGARAEVEAVIVGASAVTEKDTAASVVVIAVDTAVVNEDVVVSEAVIVVVIFLISSLHAAVALTVCTGWRGGEGEHHRRGGRGGEGEFRGRGRGRGAEGGRGRVERGGWCFIFGDRAVAHRSCEQASITKTVEATPPREPELCVARTSLRLPFDFACCTKRVACPCLYLDSYLTFL